MFGEILALSAFSYLLFNSFKKLNKTWRVRRNAKVYMGDEVSVYTDRGAKYAYKGICDYLSGDYSSSIKRFEKAMTFSTMYQNNAFCLDWMSRCYEAQEKPVELLNCCIKAVQSDPTNVKSLFNLADMYVRRGLFSKAEFYYKQVITYDKDNTAAYFLVGTLFMGRGMYEQAEEYFIKTLETDDKFTAAMSELAVLAAIDGDYKKMESYLLQIAKCEEAVKSIDRAETERLKKRLNSIRKMKELCNDS
ncbi:MAG: hypothetical protein FWF82_00395 [Oscillospiraceae bacterium]|nr:hypothetical protein [Oscillospiraceae bacterium]